MSRVTLVQWKMLAAVVDHGGFVRAAEAIHKSPSSINHAVHKLETQLGVQLLDTSGRQLRLTESGEMLLRRARQLLESAETLEAVADSLSGGLEAEISIGIDQILGPEALCYALDRFSAQYPHTRIQLHESVLNGGIEMLLDNRVDLLICGLPVPGYLGELMGAIRFIAVAHPDHVLHQLNRPLDLRDLRQHRQIVIRDSAQREQNDSGWLKAEQRWTVSHVATCLDILARGLGFAWVSQSRVQPLLDSGRLKALPLQAGGIREVPLSLYINDVEGTGPAVQAMAEALRHEFRS
ncbi:LysR family transcriptional regulator [Kushneria marisflavi]|uniref:LysR family transcriptional regulator n=1 Tax=Kushneria marisflavi TaxID=157779 RepID=A0A240UM15_9GAMM|nr:LysR family transcriptional regulator [Kushneria marisflavi]ART62082.1 LysR family transcriptional regulator [Kushneria marisflavi]RKD87153.1 DNA-binding transcriptional LysR family regulator [Kushneria marisflavi]